MSVEFTQAALESLRDERYHRTPALRAHTEVDALRFVDEVGFCFLFGDKHVEIPTLWGAVTGSRRPLPGTNRDPDVGRTWTWKDSLPAKGLIFYGKLLRGKPTLVSLGLLPRFYALSPNYGDPHDYLYQYEEGKLSLEAKNVYEALLAGGAMSTTRLRREAGLSGGGAVARSFDRAVTELQTELKIAKVGVADSNRWGYAYVYDLFVRAFPDVPEAARSISTDQAEAALLETYLRNVVAVPAAVAQRLFRWDPWEWERTLTRLRDAGRLAEDVAIEGQTEPVLALSDVTDLERRAAS